jgi:hypothetical protein
LEPHIAVSWNGCYEANCAMVATGRLWPVSDPRLADAADRYLVNSGHPSANDRFASLSCRSAR